MAAKTPISSQELAEIAARAEAARPGPWISWVEGRDHQSGSNIITVGKPEAEEADIELMGATVADQDFIAAAREDVPRLIAEIRRLRSMIAS